MYGIYLFVHILGQRLTVQEDAQWNRVFTLLAAATPPDLVDELKKEAGQSDDSWMDTGLSIVEKVLGDTM
jgi:hypothetical protein